MYAVHQPHRSRMRQKNGSSHRAYCGLCALFVTMKTARIAPQTCTKGNVPSRCARHQPTPQAAAVPITSSTGTTTLRVPVETGSLNPQYQTEFAVMSAARAFWKAYGAHHPCGERTTK